MIVSTLELVAKIAPPPDSASELLFRKVVPVKLALTPLSVTAVAIVVADIDNERRATVGDDDVLGAEVAVSQTERTFIRGKCIDEGSQTQRAAGVNRGASPEFVDPLQHDFSPNSRLFATFVRFVIDRQ